MKKLPKSVSILGKRYTIKICKIGNYGEWDGFKKEIKISNEIIQIDDQIHTIFHEAIEVVSDELGLRMTRRYGEDLYVFTHKDIDIIAGVIVEVINSAKY